MKLAKNQDEVFMHYALSLAAKGQYTSHPNPRVGCVIVQDETIVGEGLHWQCGGLHAERNALNVAKDKADGATAYVTLEPCAHYGRTAPCVDALISAKIKRVVIASLDPNPLVKGKGIQALIDAGIAVETGVLQNDAIALNKGFYSRMIRKRPFVRAKIAMSLDGRVAMKNGQSQWITSTLARKHGHLWRARSGAIVTGADTVLHDNCRLTVRDIDSLGLEDESIFRQPLRVIVDSQKRVPESAAIFQQPGKTIVPSLPKKNGHGDLSALIDLLGDEEINDVLVEAGPTLIGAMLEEKLIDEMLIYIAPKLLGSQAKPMASLLGFSQLSDHIAGNFASFERIGSDLHMVLNLNEEYIA